MATNAGKYAAITKIFVYRVGWVVESKAGCGSVEFVDWYVSHAGTVLPGCFKGDSESQCNSMEKGEIWLQTVPWTPKPMATKFCLGDEVWNPYPFAKFYHNPIRGFRSPPPPLRSPAWSAAYKVTRLVNFFGSFFFSRAKTPAPIFTIYTS